MKHASLFHDSEPPPLVRLSIGDVYCTVSLQLGMYWPLCLLTGHTNLVQYTCTQYVTVQYRERSHISWTHTVPRRHDCPAARIRLEACRVGNVARQRTTQQSLKKAKSWHGFTFNSHLQMKLERFSPVRYYVLCTQYVVCTYGKLHDKHMWLIRIETPPELLESREQQPQWQRINPLVLRMGRL